MISVDFEQDRQGLWWGFEVQGHSGYAEHGKDIICAAVSAVTQTAIVGLDQYLGDGRFKTSKVSGFLSCRLVDRVAVAMPEIQAIVSTAYLGLKAIEDNYKGYLEVKIRKRLLGVRKVH